MLDKATNYIGNILEIALYGAVLIFVLMILYTVVTAMGIV